MCRFCRDNAIGNGNEDSEWGSNGDFSVVMAAMSNLADCAKPHLLYTTTGAINWFLAPSQPFADRPCLLNPSIPSLSCHCTDGCLRRFPFSFPVLLFVFRFHVGKFTTCRVCCSTFLFVRRCFWLPSLFTLIIPLAALFSL